VREVSFWKDRELLNTLGVNVVEEKGKSENNDFGEFVLNSLREG
jgi:hypothetical protein